MADHEEAQDYKANGPTDVGFRTGGDGTGITKGVVATGTEIGVSGTALRIEGQGNGVSVGVVGNGGTAGVQGSSENGPGVWGQSGLYFGVEGVSTGGENGAGVRGWGPVIGVRGDTEHGTGVKGVSEDGTGVKGVSNQNGTGVFGDSNSGTGVEGHSHMGSGVHGRSDTDAYGGIFTSNFAQIRLEPVANSFGPPNTGSHKKGEFFVDAMGALFYCGGGSPPSWQRLAGPSVFRDFITWASRLFGARG
jgi:hypothetical protein